MATSRTQYSLMDEKDGDGEILHAELVQKIDISIIYI